MLEPVSTDLVVERWFWAEFGMSGAYFSHVLGVLSVKSSIVIRPAAEVPIWMSRKTRGRLMVVVMVCGLSTWPCK